MELEEKEKAERKKKGAKPGAPKGKRKSEATPTKAAKKKKT